jgi:hypothetical protein
MATLTGYTQSREAQAQSYEAYGERNCPFMRGSLRSCNERLWLLQGK